MIKTQINSVFIKTSIFLLFITLGGFAGLKYGQFVEKNVAQKYVEVEKKILIDDLLSCKISLDSVISKNGFLDKELIFERNRIIELLAQVKNNSFDINALVYYKNNARKLNKTIAAITTEKKLLINSNFLLKFQRDSTIVQLGTAKKQSDSILNLNDNLHSKLKKETNKVVTLNLQAFAYKQKSSGGRLMCTLARKTDVININFFVVGNASKGREATKDYFIQIIDPIHNVMGENHKYENANQTLFYSIMTTVLLDPKGRDATVDLYVKKPLKGTYTINVFERNSNVLSTTLDLM